MDPADVILPLLEDIHCVSEICLAILTQCLKWPKDSIFKTDNYYAKYIQKLARVKRQMNFLKLIWSILDFHWHSKRNLIIRLYVQFELKILTSFNYQFQASKKKSWKINKSAIKHTYQKERSKIFLFPDNQNNSRYYQDSSPSYWQLRGIEVG